ncbi:MAG: metal-dependent hydrolase [Planctomycetes bacterium]|nr:metal-dependent hydrolase [Planctomycetota bacterium]
MTDRRYPVGEFAPRPRPTAEERAPLIDEIEGLPAAVRAAVDRVGEERLDTPYRDGGWTARQVVHHLADSHINSWCRFKLTVTEDAPTIRTYDEAAWGELEDARSGPVELSLALLDALHARWGLFLRSLDDATFDRKLNHPEHGLMRLHVLLQMYAWHGTHHVAHVNLVGA